MATPVLFRSDSQNWSSVEPSDPRPPLLPMLCPIQGTFAVTHAQTLKKASRTIQRDLQPYCLGNMPFSHSHNPLGHQKLTIDDHVPQGGKNTSPRKKKDISLDPHPCSPFREAVGAAGVFPELCCGGRRRRASPKRSCFETSSSVFLPWVGSPLLESQSTEPCKSRVFLFPGPVHVDLYHCFSLKCQFPNSTSLQSVIKLCSA